jgi:TolB-like protein
VLPFDDLSADQNLGYLGDGVAEDIITALSRFPDLVVVARSSSFAYKGRAVDVRQVGKELGVGYVVEGSVRKDGDKLRIVSQLNISTKDHKTKAPTARPHRPCSHPNGGEGVSRLLLRSDSLLNQHAIALNPT